MKILQVAHGVYPYAHAGVEVYTFELSRELTDRGHEVLVAAPVPSGTLQVSNADWSIHPTPLFEGNSFPIEPSKKCRHDNRASLLRLIRATRPDIIHVQHLAHMGKETLGDLQNVGIPFIVSLPDYWFLCKGIQMMCQGSTWNCARHCSPVARHLFPYHFYRTKQRRQNAVELLNRIAAPLVTLSQRTAEIFQQSGVGAGRLIVQPWGIRTSNIRPAESGQPRPRTIRFGYLGSLKPEKGVDVLVRAFQKLSIDASLSIYGLGSMGFTEKLQQLAIGASVKFFGGYDHLELRKILSTIDVLVVPSVWEETYGLVAQEALGARKVVVASSVGGLQDRFVHGINGFLSPPGDADALAKQMMYVANDYDEISSNLQFDFSQQDIRVDGERFENLYQWTKQNWKSLCNGEISPIEWEWREVATQLSDYLGEDQQEISHRLKQEWLSPGSTVGNAWKNANPTTDSEIDSFYEQTDSYLYDLLVVHRTADRRRWRNAAVQLLRKNKINSIFDYGGGCGDDALFFLSLGFDCTLFDRGRANREFATYRAQQSGHNLNVVHEIPPSTYDAVFCTEMLEHVPHPFREIEKMRTLLNPNGIALLTHSFDLLGDSHPSHLARHRGLAATFVGEVEKLGFQLDEVLVVPGNRFFAFRKSEKNEVTTVDYLPLETTRQHETLESV